MISRDDSRVRLLISEAMAGAYGRSAATWATAAPERGGAFEGAKARASSSSLPVGALAAADGTSRAPLGLHQRPRLARASRCSTMAPVSRFPMRRDMSVSLVRSLVGRMRESRFNERKSMPSTYLLSSPRRSSSLATSPAAVHPRGKPSISSTSSMVIPKD